MTFSNMRPRNQSYCVLPSTVSLPWSSIGWFSTEPFVVFVAPEGLYGWKALGPVTNANRRYFEPYREMLDDTEFMRDLRAIRKLASLSGGFSYQRSDITSVTPDDRRQWGMGGIAHAGHVHLRLVSGRTRKLILLGEVILEQVRDSIVATLGAGVTSVV
jgi:hypothetical protein